MSEVLELNPKTLLDDPTAGYRPRPLGFFPGWTWFRREHFSAMHVEAMLCDPQVCLGYAMRTAPLYLGEYEVEAKKPEVKKWVEDQLETLKQSLRVLLRFMGWGYGAYQICDDTENGYLVIDGVKDFHPLDAFPLRRKSTRELWGMRIHNVQDESQGVDLELGKGIWLAQDAHYGMLHGLSVLNGAFWAWLEKIGKDGAEDIRRLWFYKDAFRGELVRYPQINLKTSEGTLKEAKDVAIEMTTLLKTGGLLALPNARDEKGNYIWEVQFAKMGDGAEGLLAYIDHLDARIFRGIGLPDDVVSQPDSGGGTYGGRRVGWEAFLTICQQDWVYLLKALEKQVLRPRACLNFEKAQFKIKAKSLLESQSADVRGQQQPGAPATGTAGMPGQNPNAGVPTGTPNPFGGGQVQMGFGDMRAPKGGVTLADKFYPGGEFIPSEAIEAAPDDERMHLHLQGLKSIYENVGDHSHEQIREHMAALASNLSPNEAASLHQAFGIAGKPRSKTHAIQQIHDRLSRRKGSMDRVRSITDEQPNPVVGGAEEGRTRLGHTDAPTTVYERLRQELASRLRFGVTGTGEWQSFGTSKHGTPRWKSVRTGRVVYQAEPPGANQHEGQDESDPHEAILQHLRAGDKVTAGKLLEEHAARHGMQPHEKYELAGRLVEEAKGAEDRPQSIAESGREAERAVREHDVKMKGLADKLADGAEVDGWTKITTGGDVFWEKGDKHVTFLHKEVGTKKVEEAVQPTGPKAKHEMTQAEFIAHKKATDPGWREAQYKTWHQDALRKAIKEGKTVPEHVLADYPAIKKQLDKKRGKHEDLEGMGRGSESGGLPERSLGADAGAAHPELPAGTGRGAGDGTAGLSDGEDARRAGDVSPAAGERDAGAGGEGDGDGASAAEAGGRDREGASVRGRGRDIHAGGSGPSSPAEESLSEPASPENPTDLAAGNWRYQDREFYKGGLKTKFRNNVAAIKTLITMRREGRKPTPEEQAVLSKFVGWGAFPAVFNTYHEDPTPWRERERLEQTLSEEEYEARFGYDKWKAEREELQGLLSEEEWDAAKGSTLNAHYTHPDVIDAHWKMAQKLGFKGGRFLETSAGNGYYLGLMPPELASKTHASAVELDKVTGDILKNLYPSAHCQTQGFQDHLAPDGFYDLVASNVPFGDYQVSDPRYNKHKAPIHDYFFLKSADLVRPGGLVMHVTSKGTLDKQDPSIRQELAKQCDLVAALRFPGRTHKENAGTDVVTDMVILRKRLPGEAPSGPNWMETVMVPDPVGGEAIPVNKYFADHPEQILGTLDRTGTMYRADSVNVSKTDDYEQRLQSAIDRLPANIMKPHKPSQAFMPEKLPAPGDVKEGGYAIEDGKLYVRDGGALVEHKASAGDIGKIGGMMAVRDAWRKLAAAEISGQESAGPRVELNRAYDAFVEKHGFLHSPKNMKLFAQDPDGPTLLAMEKWDAAAKSATKADLFSKETIRWIPPVEKAETVQDGLGVSLHERGGVDVEHIAKLTGKSAQHVGAHLTEHGLAYEDPGEGWKPADQYLSGNVRRKLALAQAAAANDPKFQKNVEALLKVQPEDVHDIDAKLGVPWIKPDDYAEFAAHLLGGRAEHFSIGYLSHNGKWLMDYSPSGNRTISGSKAAVDIWATKRMSFDDLYQHALNGTTPLIYDKAEDDKKVLNQQATEDAQAKVQEMRDKFKEWVFDDDERRERLHRVYNDNFNNIVPMKYNGAHLKFPGLNPNFKPHAHIPNFVWQVVTTGRGLAGHEVGMGKTAAMGMSAMELRRLGLARKPMIACLKANVESVTAEIRSMYPGAKILSTVGKFSQKERRKTMAQIATGDHDVVICTHDNLNMLKMRPETRAKYIREELAELETAIVAAQADNPKKGNRIVKQLEKAKKNLEKTLTDALTEERKDDSVYFEELGVDQLFVDEAHKYKALPVYTQMQRVKGVPTSRSQRATNMLMRTRWIQEQNGGRGVVFATGTPIANTTAELYNMQRYLQPQELEERGVKSFDAWARTFGEIQTKLEPTATGEYKQVSRFNKFVNIPELMQIARQVLDVQRVDDLPKKPDGSPGIVRPKRHDKPIVSPESEAIQNLMKSLQERAKAIKQKKGPPQKGDDNMLVVCTDGRKGALDMRLLDDTVPDDPNSKTNLCVQNVLQLHRANPGVTQIIFSDLGVNPQKEKVRKEAPDDDDDGEDSVTEGGMGWSDIDTGSKGRFRLYDDIINKLVAGGIPREKIADFSKLEGAKKEAAQLAMRNGEIVVAIGGTEKLGTGVNVQNKLAALHHLDVPWLPAHIEQRDGRGIRQGNENKNCHVYRYVTEGSLDEMFWSIISKKSSFIRQIMTTGSNVARTEQETDTEELTPEQLEAISSGDPRVLERVTVADELKQLKGAADRHRREQDRFHGTLKTGEKQAPEIKKFADAMAADIEHLEKHKQHTPDFAMKVGDRTYTERGEAEEALDQAVLALKQKWDDEPEWNRRFKDGWDEHVPIGEYRGHQVSVKPSEAVRRGESDLERMRNIKLTSPNNLEWEAYNTPRSIEGMLRTLPQKHTELLEKHRKHLEDLETIRGKTGKEFPHAKLLAEKETRLKQLEDELRAESADKNEEDADQEEPEYRSPTLPEAEIPASGKDIEAFGRKLPEDSYASVKGKRGVEIGPFVIVKGGPSEWEVYHHRSELRLFKTDKKDIAKAGAYIAASKGNWEFHEQKDADEVTIDHGREVYQAMNAYDLDKLASLAHSGFQFGYRFAAAHAPAGYTHQKPLVIAGRPFVGGEFIPSEYVAKAPPEVKAQLVQTGQQSGGKHGIQSAQTVARSTQQIKDLNQHALAAIQRLYGKDIPPVPEPPAHPEGGLQNMDQAHEYHAEMKKWCKQIEHHPYYKAAKRLVETTVPTDHLYAKGGQWTNERKWIHDAFVHQSLRPETKAKPGERPKAVIVIGPPGAGKSTAGVPLIKHMLNMDSGQTFVKRGTQGSGTAGLGHGQLHASGDFVAINADDAKAFLPEYAGWNAGQLHEESSEMIEGDNGLYTKALAGQHHMILDVTGANGDKVNKWASALGKHGYEVHAIYVDYPAHKSAGRCVSRFLNNPFGANGEHHEPGRLVPPWYAYEGVDHKPDLTYTQLKENSAVHSWQRISTDVPKGAKPIMLDRGHRGAERYSTQAGINIGILSRTARGALDTSASPAKAGHMAVTDGNEAANIVWNNFLGTVKDLHGMKDHKIQSPEHAEEFADLTARAINRGITKEGVLHRTDDSTKLPYTKIDQLPEARKQFSEEFHKRINDPKQDPIELAAWLHWRVNMTDHFYADGCGKTAEALASWALMRKGYPMPKVKSREEWFANTSRERPDPSKPESYYGPGYKKWVDYYRSLFN